MTLTDFLLARIAEDEAVARRDLAPIFDGSDFFWLDDEPSFPALIVDPARVLAECEAKRRIVDASTREADALDRTTPGVGAVLRNSAWDLRNIAAIYADHPDYRDEWRP